jgi:hypothetical protein
MVINRPSVTSNTGWGRVRLPRSLFRRLMARAILERTDLNSIVIRAIRTARPEEGRGRRGGARALERGAGPA